MKTNKIYIGNCTEVLKTFPDNCVDMVVTSPPYWQLRNYEMDGQLGLEKTPEEYVENLVKVFRKIKRVLKPNGTVWLNLGDCYYGGGWKGDKSDKSKSKQATNKGSMCGKTMQHDQPHPIIKTKDLVGIPWMTAFALRKDGWFLRQDIVWFKTNSMPESVTDRCTKSHEYVFLLSKSPKYYFDYKAIQEIATGYDGRKDTKMKGSLKYKKAVMPNSTEHTMALRGHQRWQTNEKGSMLRNKRSVWSIPNKANNEKHYASFPVKLIKPMILAGSKENDIVLDPFMGIGTTAIVAKRLGRRFVGIELNPQYAKRAIIRAERAVYKPKLLNLK